MAEPIPSAVDGDETKQNLPANAEDRKAAKALDALDSNTLEGEADSGGSQQKQIDQDALGKAMNRLEIAAGASKKNDSSNATKKPSKWEEKQRLEEEETKRKKAVKVKVEDVAFLVEELEVSKVKATDLLKSYEGDPGKALKAFIQPSAHIKA